MEFDKDQGREALLAHVEDQNDGECYDARVESTFQHHPRGQAAYFYLSLVANAFLLPAILLLWLTHPKVRYHDPQLDLNSPLNHLVEYEDVVFYDNIRHFSPYQMPPDDDIDEMWSQLYDHSSTTRIPAKAAHLLPNATVVIPGSDGDGLVQIEMFHVLHCVNTLRKSIWPERFPDYAVFYPNGSRNDAMTTHLMHCIDRLRQNTMCAGNLGTNYWRWRRDDSGQMRWMMEMGITYRCRKFEPIREWTLENELMGFDDTSPSELTS